MTSDNRDLLTVLKKELEFLEKGGYRHTKRTAWRAQYVFQDSPTCLNFDPTQPARPCSECILMRLVPKEMHHAKVPCRYIPLSNRGETVDSFYRSGTQEELELALRQWLGAAILRLEKHTIESQAPAEPVEIHVKATGRLAG